MKLVPDNMYVYLTVPFNGPFQVPIKILDGLALWNGAVQKIIAGFLVANSTDVSILLMLSQ